MKTHTLIQGSPEWHQYRATVWNASDAPAMMGCSPYKTRDQLLKELATGITEEVSPELQRRFDDGHRFEALANPLAEKITGEELAPVVGSSDETIAGRVLSASFDGIDFLETVAFEHKTLNNTLRECMEGLDESNRLPLHYRVQMQQQIMVSGASRILFMASKWDGDKLVEERHCWYYPDDELAAKIRAGWAQLAQDLTAWKPQAVDVKPVGKSPETLPALRIELNGAVTTSNLAEFKQVALSMFKDIKRAPSTDEEFADAERTVKWCSDVESRLAAAKEHALSQTADIDALFKAIDDISAEARRVRLDLDKAVKARKDQIRVEIVNEHSCTLQAHVDGLNAALGARWVVYPAAAFGEAIKGKKTVTSIREACSVVLAEAKIMVNQAAERFKANRAALVIDGRDWISLFADFATVGNKAPDDFEAVAQLRISKHVEAERQAAEARQRAEAAAQAAIEAAAQKSAQPAAQTEAPAPAAVPLAAAPWVEPTPASDDGYVVTTGEICTRLGPGLTVTVDFLKARGFSPVESKTPGTRWRGSDFPRMCQAIAEHIQACGRTQIPLSA